MIRYAVFLVLLMALGFVATRDDDAMAKCQEKFSHDVCFQVLNR
jgi:hypothetical protein